VKLVRDLHIKLNFTVVMATHDLDTLVSVSDRIAVLADQKVVVCGRLDEVVRYDHPFIRDFFLGERGRRALSAAPALQTN
jgi:phospholipid/cholesterol/gamma-HCH transport system ATP-binding protein